MRRTSLKIVEDILRLLTKGDLSSTAIQKRARINSRVFASKMGPLVGCGAVVFREESRVWTLSQKGRDILRQAADLNRELGSETQ